MEAARRQCQDRELIQKRILMASLRGRLLADGSVSQKPLIAVVIREDRHPVCTHEERNKQINVFGAFFYKN